MSSRVSPIVSRVGSWLVVRGRWSLCGSGTYSGDERNLSNPPAHSDDESFDSADALAEVPFLQHAPDMAGRFTLVVCLLAFMLLMVLIVHLRVRLERHRALVDDLYLELED